MYQGLLQGVLHVIGALIFVRSPLFVAALHGMSLAGLALKAEVLYPGSHGAVATGEMAPGMVPIPRHGKDSVLGHTAQSFCDEALCIYPGALVRGTDFRSGTHLFSGLWSCSQGTQTIHVILILPSCPASACQDHTEKSLYICLEH